MGNKYVVDTKVIDEAIVSLKKLQAECSKYAESKLPKNNTDKGKTHDESKQFLKNLRTSFAEMEKLIDKTIVFLGGESKTITESDKASARSISSGGGGSSAPGSLGMGGRGSGGGFR